MKNQAQLNDIALLVLRIVAGLVLLYYGSQKMLGVFGGQGFQESINGMSKGTGFPIFLIVLAIFAEFFGSIGLIVGLLTRVAAFGVFCTMSVATWVSVKSSGGLVATATNTNPLRDAAYPLLIGTIALSVLLMGGGQYALDAKVFGRRRRA